MYPRWLQIVVECLPLHHGIEMLRDLNAGVIGWSLLGHAAYFAVMAAVGGVAAVPSSSAVRGAASLPTSAHPSSVRSTVASRIDRPNQPMP